ISVVTDSPPKTRWLWSGKKTTYFIWFLAYRQIQATWAHYAPRSGRIGEAPAHRSLDAPGVQTQFGQQGLLLAVIDELVGQTQLQHWPQDGDTIEVFLHRTACAAHDGGF